VSATNDAEDAIHDAEERLGAVEDEIIALMADEDTRGDELLSVVEVLIKRLPQLRERLDRRIDKLEDARSAIIGDDE
jgi:hypothetical protein